MFLHALNWAIVPERDVTIPTEKIKKERKRERYTDKENRETMK